MIPVIVVVAATLVARAAGALGVDAVDSWNRSVRVGLALMLVLTASAHFGSRRADLVRMVPPGVPGPEAMVTLTGVAELAVAVGLLFDRTAGLAAAVLVVLLVTMFPANVHAARSNVGIGGRPPTPLVPRALIQLLFIAAAVTAAA